MRVIASFTLILLTVLPVHAETVYSYVGGTFVIVTGAYTTNDRITGSFTMADGFTPAGFGCSDPSCEWRTGVLGWSFTDGHQTLTEQNSTAAVIRWFYSGGTFGPYWLVGFGNADGGFTSLNNGDWGDSAVSVAGSGAQGCCGGLVGGTGMGRWTVQTVFRLGSSGHDTYVRSGAPNTNEGASAFLRLAASQNRALVRFDQTRLVDLVAGRTVASAILRMNIVDSGDNWSTAGRTVDIHRMTVDWAEGNGRDADYSRSESFRGDEPGATWNCAIDSDTSNFRSDCSDATEWEMSRPRRPDLHPWVFDPTATVLITNGLTGQVELDVTADVQAFIAGTAPNYGWIIKKTEEGQPGRVDFASRESGQGSILLITYITYGP